MNVASRHESLSSATFPAVTRNSTNATGRYLRKAIVWSTPAAAPPAIRPSGGGVSAAGEVMAEPTATRPPTGEALAIAETKRRCA